MPHVLYPGLNPAYIVPGQYRSPQYPTNAQLPPPYPTYQPNSRLGSRPDMYLSYTPMLVQPLPLQERRQQQHRPKLIIDPEAAARTYPPRFPKPSRNSRMLQPPDETNTIAATPRSTTKTAPGGAKNQQPSQESVVSSQPRLQDLMSEKKHNQGHDEEHGGDNGHSVKEKQAPTKPADQVFNPGSWCCCEPGQSCWRYMC